MAAMGRMSSGGNGDGGYSGPRAGDLTVGDYANGMPNIRLGEMVKSFFRQMGWLIPLLLIGTAASWHFTKEFKRLYEGEGRILVQLGSEYVYESVTGNQSASLTQTPDHIVLNEIGIMKNTDLIARVTGELRDEFGERRFAKSYYEKINAAGNDPIAKKNAIVDLYRFMDKRFVVIPKPKSSVVDMVFKHEDPDIAVRGIDLFLKAYLDSRKDIFVEGASDVISERREATEQQLNQNEQAIQRFLSQNNVSDFQSEQEGARKRTEALRAELNTLRALMAETETALATVETQLRGTPEQIDLYVDDRASQRIAQADLELKQLLAKYLPGSNPVRLKQEEIRRLREIATASGGRATGGRRVGPNTVYQSLLTRRNTLQASADSYREKEFTLQRQLDSADAKVRRFNGLSPKYSNLIRERSTLDERLKGYTAKEQEALINQQQAQADSENVRVISVSNLPRKGRNIRMIMFAVATLAWAFTLFMLALLRVFLDPRLYAPTGPNDRLRARSEPHPEDHYIPEPVAPYQPIHDPVPDPVIVPAAASAVPAASYEPEQWQAPNYADVATYDEAATAYATQSYGNTALAPAYETNPYASGQIQAAHALQATESQPYYADPVEYNPEVPVIGTVPSSADT